MNTVAVVRAGPGDAPRLAQCHAASFERPWDAGEFDRLLAGGAAGFVALGESECVRGVLILRHGGGEGEVLTLGVAPEARRQGIARKLLSEGCEFLREVGAGRLFLEVAEINAPARALYRALGFTSVGRRPNYYAERDRAGRVVGRRAAVVMERTLL